VVRQTTSPLGTCRTVAVVHVLAAGMFADNGGSPSVRETPRPRAGVIDDEPASLEPGREFALRVTAGTRRRVVLDDARLGVPGVERHVGSHRIAM